MPWVNGLLIMCMATVTTFPVMCRKFTTSCLNLHMLSTHQNTQGNILSIFTNIRALIVGLPSQASRICKFKDDYNASKSKHCGVSRLGRKKHNMTHNILLPEFSGVSTVSWKKSKCIFKIFGTVYFSSCRLRGILRKR